VSNAAQTPAEEQWPIPRPAAGRSLSGRVWAWRAEPQPLYESARLGCDELAARLFTARGATARDMERLLRPTLRDWMPDPSCLPDMDAASERLADAVARNESVAVFADYDVDGATSAAILIRHLRALGMEPRHHVPDRLLEGYGPSAEALVALARAGASLAVVLDCGTQGYAALEAARAAGLDVIVIDHHKASPALPPALALVNPCRLDAGEEAAAHAHLCTAGLTFLLVAALNRSLRRRGHFSTAVEPRPAALLDLVALGTVADMVPLHGLNRAFVTLGLRRLAESPNPGIAALLAVGGAGPVPTPRDLGFVAGPRINAAGRIGQADLGLRLLSSDHAPEIEEIAAMLEQLNAERRTIEADVTEAALAMAGQHANAPVAVVAGRGWHPGVVGIAAARVKERIGRPAIVIGLDANGLGKGSGRSIAGVDLGAAVLAARESGLLLAGGGHAMAAGVTVAADAVDRFASWMCERLDREVAKAIAGDRLRIDLTVAPRGLDMGLADGLEVAGPYGQGWPVPRVAVGPVRLVEAATVGASAAHVRFVGTSGDGGRVQGVAFRTAGTPLGDALLQGRGRSFWLAGRVEVNRWQGRERAELHLDDAAAAD
jgi:single-stranded-DNA-specific exonuclease